MAIAQSVNEVRKYLRFDPFRQSSGRPSISDQLACSLQITRRLYGPKKERYDAFHTFNNKPSRWHQMVVMNQSMAKRPTKANLTAYQYQVYLVCIQSLLQHKDQCHI